MKDLARILVTGYLVKKFLAPKIYPAIDEALEALPVDLPSRITTVIDGQEVVVSDKPPEATPEQVVTRVKGRDILVGEIIAPEREVTPFEAVEQSIIVDRHEIIAEPSLIVSSLVYPRRRS